MIYKCRSTALGAVILTGLFHSPVCAIGVQSPEGTLQRYTDTENLTRLPWGSRSHWIQPWRAYMDTWPSSRIENSVGINYQNNADPASVDAIFKHLAKNGFKFVRIEFGWNNISYDDPSKLTRQDTFDNLISACKNSGLRPLILLNSNHGIPCPMKQYVVKLTQPAAKGDTQVHIDPSTLKLAVVDRSGLSNLSSRGWGAENLFTQIMPDGTCSLSKALTKDLSAGPAPAMTLKYLPFYPSKDKATGLEPPQFQETIAGWQLYIKTIASNMKRVLGTENAADAGFDFEVWNEMTFGSNFLDINKYYDKPIVQGEYSPAAIAKYTVDFVRDPKNHMPNVGITDGFEAQRPWASGSTLPAGLTAMSKHPYRGMTIYPYTKGVLAGQPLDALGGVAGQKAKGQWVDNFSPVYAAFFPEYFLSGNQTETLIRDLAPFNSNVGNFPHGRDTHAVFENGNDAPPPGMWVTEVNIDARGADPGFLLEYRFGGLSKVDSTMTTADVDRLKAKAALRYLTSYVNKGVSRIYFFEAVDREPAGLGMMSSDFLPAVKTNNNAIPSDDSAITSFAMLSIRRLIAAMKGDDTIVKARQISLQKIVEPESRVQFAGNPATTNSSPNPFPPLYNREVLAFFPFQATKHKFVIPVYVMTRNMVQRYKADAPNSDITRFDMPEETFRLDIGNIMGTDAKVSLYDPLTGMQAKVTVLRSGTKNIEIEAALTDSPRVLVIEEN